MRKNNGAASALKAGAFSIFATAVLIVGITASAYAFPKDFQGFSGFGGDDALDQSGNQAKLKHIPVILLHGNGGSATHNQWGMTKMRDMLYASGYNPSEVWAVSYLKGGVELYGVHKNHVDDVRNFIEAVKKYLGVQKVDIVAHSLGATLGRAYLAGFQRSGKFDQAARKFDSVSTFVSLSGAHDGLGPYSMDEFKTGSDFLRGLNAIGSVIDQTPYGPSKEDSEKGDFKGVTPLDNDQCTYVSFWASGDFVDQQRANTGALRGADINKGFSLGMSLTGHERIIKDPQVVSEFLPYLNHQNVKPTPKAVDMTRTTTDGTGRSLPSISRFSELKWDGGASFVAAALR
jgi:pimeloyl-ACP methyl ester carboxylesterase